MMNYNWQPEYVDKFYCQGDICKADCCRYWNIYIDNESYNKYKKIEDVKSRVKITSSIENKENKYIIKFNDDESCPLLCEDSMCYIQRNFGETYLSIICKVYPRHLVLLDRTPVHLLSMSCPIALEEAIFSRDGMRLKKSTINSLPWHGKMSIEGIDMNL